MEAINSEAIEGDNSEIFFSTQKNKIGLWEGRYVKKEGTASGELGKLTPAPSYENSAPLGMKTCGFLWGYFDPKKKEEQEFEIQMLIWAIHCQSPEEEEQKKKILTSLAKTSLKIGTIAALVIKRDYIGTALTAGIFVMDIMDNCIRTVEEFKKHIKDQGKSFSDVRFYNWAEENEKNRQDLIMKGIILEKDESSRHYHGNPHFTDNPHYTKPLC